ncbi:putative HlyD-family secretion protein [Bradyrhizobium sp. ORS 375]|uniref:HlyD family secretion protein n=1 Tax=Bradyrhizobium sp. (strain ORS 375) TaxID=566679 RepID=UPI00024080DC|nr:HlyD family efflux transporter periplasmic adaptor subunit [Bradyrhizobium sp. ORS 375]CCD96853.1 putative HlyD-family secretion protein [Bradyrhizobium sp. ORS 375]
MDPQDTQVIGDERPVQHVRAEAAALVPAPVLPAPVTHAPRPARKRWPFVLLALVLCAAGGGGYVWWQQLHPPLPLGISVSNGRIEADEIDIATKYAGRVAELRVDIGDLVESGQIVARMDSKELQQSLAKAQAQAEQAQHVVDQARASLAQMQTQKTLAEQEMERTRSLLQNGWTTKEIADQRQQALDAATAGLAGSQARISEAERALEAVRHDVALYTVQIADNSLIAPKAGRIQYRLANVGEVLGAGGKVFTMLDVGYVYMDVFLSTEEVGKIKVGSDARIVLDAYPDRPIPAKVSFVASQAQFTPKTVETRSERDKLMFRVRVRVDPDRLTAHADAVRSGLPGVAYVRWNSDVAWPARLQPAP